MTEAGLMREIQKKASSMGWRLFRNNTGAYRRARALIRYGLCVGSSDLIGWTDTGRFVAIEVKAGSPTTKAQQQFLEAVIRSGGVGLIAHSLEDLK